MLARAVRNVEHRRCARRDDEGATALEFALVLPVVVAVCFFAIYGAMFFFYSAVADHVARTVARQVSIPTTNSGTTYPDSSAATVLSDAKSAAGTLIPNPTTAVATSLPSSGTPEQGDLVTVTVTYKLPLLSGLGGLVPGLSSIDSISRSASERRQ
ncbi:MAG TPA: TadE/TadG family type IV pilus assembly protein [Mycobacteriales bacterium]|nr:TadE/TadG family type IV pilus assembly protein [Mycobacteriales bacterium]